MQDSQDQGENQEALSEEVNASLGLNKEPSGDQGGDSDELPEAAKKRLGMQEKRHKKQIRRMQEQLDDLTNKFHSRAPSGNSSDHAEQYSGNGGMDETVYKAVAKALELQKMQEHKAKQDERMQYVHKSYKNLQDNLDNASSKYEDFDDIVKSDDAPYTDAMRDAALLIENAPDVLYHLGKDKEKLKRISDLHPIDQAKEVIKLSQALAIGNNGAGKQNASNAKPLGQVKNNPISSNTVNDATSVAEIRKRMKDGGKKWG